VSGKRVVITGGTFEEPAPQPGFRSRRSYVQRQLEVTVQLAASQATGQPITFAGTAGSDTVTLSGFRTRVRIENSGAPAGSRASISVFGMPNDLVNQLSTLGMIFNSVQRNIVTVSAGDSESGMSPVFAGVAGLAFGDFNQSPKVPFRFECQTGLFESVMPAAASSFPQSTDVATMMSGWARQMNLGFENNGVTVQLPPSYFPGSIMQQVRRAARAAAINAEIVDGNTKLAIWPLGGSRSVPTVPLISRETGMIGYPSFAPNGWLIVRSLFIPQVAFGGKIRVESIIPQANKAWVVQKLDLALDAKVPRGDWSMTMLCYPEGFAAPPPPNAGAP
jgi:hypothetical protein